MKISTKGRYALVIMLNLANKYDTNEYVSLTDIANKEKLSLKYLEKNLSDLSTDTWNKIGDILRCAEGDIAVTDCVTHVCLNHHNCKTYPLWMELNNVINAFLDSKTLKDYMEVK